MHNFSTFWCEKETDLGLGVSMHMDFLCIDAAVHAMGLGPAPPLQGEPEKLPWQKSNVHEPRYGSLPLVLAQARRDEAKTWVLYGTNIGYPSIIIWGPGPLGGHEPIRNLQYAWLELNVGDHPL